MRARLGSHIVRRTAAARLSGCCTASCTPWAARAAAASLQPHPPTSCPGRCPCQPASCQPPAPSAAAPAPAQPGRGQTQMQSAVGIRHQHPLHAASLLCTCAPDLLCVLPRRLLSKKKPAAQATLPNPAISGRQGATAGPSTGTAGGQSRATPPTRLSSLAVSRRLALWMSASAALCWPSCSSALARRISACGAARGMPGARWASQRTCSEVQGAMHVLLPSPGRPGVGAGQGPLIRACEGQCSNAEQRGVPLAALCSAMGPRQRELSGSYHAPVPHLEKVGLALQCRAALRHRILEPARSKRVKEGGTVGLVNDRPIAVDHAACAKLGGQSWHAPALVGKECRRSTCNRLHPCIESVVSHAVKQLWAVTGGMHTTHIGLQASTKVAHRLCIMWQAALLLCSRAASGAVAGTSPRALS